MKNEQAIFPDLEMSDFLSKESFSNFRSCFACYSCRVECPVNVFANKLNPARLVRLACFGLIDTLIREPEIWYCIECGKCSNICPMNVKPHLLIMYARHEAIRQGLVSKEIMESLFELQRQFQHIRLHLLDKCLNGEEPDAKLLEQWDTLTKVSPRDKPTIILSNISGRKDSDYYEGIPIDIKACFTCRECSNSCPICFEQSVFDPLILFRLINLGLSDEALSKASFWLCIECETCSKICTQGVKGHLLIKWLKKKALQSGVVNKDFLTRWDNAQRLLFETFVNKVNSLLTRFSQQ